MAIDDEPRRSGRATKGQHTKDREDSETPAKQKGRGKGRKSNPEPELEPEDEESETIRCICGEYEEEEDLPRAMICCDRCEAWQHNSCMGLPEEWPEKKKYFCEQCKPQDHKELLAAIKRGEKPWEMAKQRMQQAYAEELAAKKKGKKGGRKSNARQVESQRTHSAEPEEPPASKKRKLEESPAPEVETKTKRARGNTRKSANGAVASAEPEEVEAEDEEMVEEPEAEAEVEPEEEAEPELEPEPEPEPENPALVGVANDPKAIGDSSRSRVATNLVKVFGDQVSNLVQSGDLSLSKGETAKQLGMKIALQVEHAVYYFKSGGSGETSESYKDQIRAILNNIKSNPDLATRLMTGLLGPDKLADMNPRDMATEEQKQKDAEEQMRLEKQHILVEENQGPRIRKTHKGDEYVDGSGQPAESTTSKPTPKPAVNIAVQDNEMKSPTDAGKSAIMRKPSASSKGRPFGDARRKSSSNFDIDKVWSGVQNSPTDGEAPKILEAPHRGSPPPVQNSTDADPEVDRLLKDEDNDNESQPYSPKEYNDPEVVWRGRVAGGSLGTFYTTAKYAAGCKPDVENLSMTWEQLIPDEFKLHGRIQPSKADDYLCGLEYSNTTELVIISLAEPTDPEGKKQFDKFFNYLKTKERYGVVSQHSVPAIKDIYLLPMEVGSPLPSVMKALENQYPDPVTERCFLVPIVVKWTELPHNAERARLFFQAQAQQAAQSPSVQPPVAQTPMTPSEPTMLQFEPPRQPFAQNQTSVNGGSSATYSTPPPTYTTHPVVQPPPQTQSTAAVTAHRILGPEMAALPAVVDLITQVPTAGEHEMKIIKECVEENAEAGRSLTVLTQMLQQKHKDQKSTQAAASAVGTSTDTATATATGADQAQAQSSAPVAAET